MSKSLYKATITIWSEFDPTKLELTELAHEAEVGEAYCSKLAAIKVDKPSADPDWDGTEFFDERFDEVDE